MNIADDKLTREQAFAACIFLWSERERHIRDINLINRALEKLSISFNFTSKEVERFKEYSKRYIELKEEK